MALFNICNKVSAADLGNYEGDTEAEALDAFARDAGYASFDAACAEVGGKDDIVIKQIAATPAQFVAARGNRTQTQLAELLDVSRATIQNWENGRVAIPRIAWLAMQSLSE